MRNLKLPSRNLAREHLKTAIYKYKYGGKERGHDISEDEIDKILSLYDLYDASNGSSKRKLKGEGLDASLLKAIHHAYGQTYEGKKLYSIRQDLFAGVTCCPICGIEPVTQLDHHLPEAIFNPLAIYTRNLIPLCQPCNFTKLAGFGGEDGAGLDFVHAYFDILPDVQFFKADLDIRDDGLVIQFGIDADIALPKDYAARLSAQIVDLNLNDRYQKEVNTYISSQAVTLHTRYACDGAAGVRAFLKAQARHEHRVFYRNHWRPTLLAALAQHDAFINGGFADVLPVDKDILDDLLRVD
jgi:hypothetical protein